MRSSKKCNFEDSDDSDWKNETIDDNSTNDKEDCDGNIEASSIDYLLFDNIMCGMLFLLHSSDTDEIEHCDSFSRYKGRSKQTKPIHDSFHLFFANQLVEERTNHKTKNFVCLETIIAKRGM